MVFILVPGLVSSLSVTNTTLLITWDPPLTPSGDMRFATREREDRKVGEW